MWEVRSGESLGLNEARLQEVAATLGGRGCIVKNGYIVLSWGDQAERSDWMSSAKAVFSTLLFFALHEGRVRSVDQPIAEFGWDLRPKDRGITFRHLGAMTSGYARPEGPGEAWAYNDFAIQLYQKTLFDRVFRADPAEVAVDGKRLGALGLQDGLRFAPSTRRLSASVRDFARIAWFWLQRGRWDERQILPRALFDRWMRPQTPTDLPHTRKAETDDYLGLGSFGGDSDHFTVDGAGIYGFNWWFNATGRRHPNTRTWPDALPDTVMSIGFGGNCTALMPSLGLLLVSACGQWGDLAAGDPSSTMNRILSTMAESAGHRLKAATPDSAAS